MHTACWPDTLAWGALSVLRMHNKHKLTIAPGATVMVLTLTVLLAWEQPYSTTLPVMVMSVAAVALAYSVSHRV